MTSHFTQPENALKRANEYIGVGDRASALQTLHSILGTKRHHAKDKAGQKVLERVMLKYLDLCVEMRRGQMAKDGIHQYKYILKLSKGAPQAQHASCLEVVIRHFLSKAEKALADVHAKSADKIIDVADLDEEDSLGQSAGGKEKQVGVTSWMRFLWESYRIVLEILRNLPKLEELYAFTAQQAFGFCHTFSRTNEFRRLSEILRNHLQALSKAAANNNQQQGMSLSNPETVQLLLEIRFAQLNVATKMGLWQESFRSVEDVHGLIALSKKPPPPERMCLYYEKLTQIFWQAKNYLFHAYSCIKYFKALQKVKPDMTDEQKGALGSQVLLAALSIPVTADSESNLEFDFDVQKEKNYRLASLLGLSSPLPRGALIADLVNKGILGIAYPELVQFYKLTESQFSPLTFSAAISKHLEFIRGRGELQVYAGAVAANCFRRLMQRLAPYFQTVKLARLAGLAKFIAPEEVEQLIIDAVSRGLFSVRIDHRVGVVRFSSDRLDSDDMKCCLSSMSSRLETTAQSFESVKKQQVACKQRVFATAMESLEEEHTSILIRKAFIEKRKEAEEEKNRRKKLEEEQRKVEEALEKKKIEEKHSEDMKKRQEEIQGKIQKARAELIQKEVEDSKNQSVKVQLEKLKEEKETREKRLKSLNKKLDHLERARRQEERPLLEALFQTQLKEDKEYHKEQFQKSLEERQSRHQQQLEVKVRILKILPHREKFEGVVSEGRKRSFESVLDKEQQRRDSLQKRLDEALDKQKVLFVKKERLETQKRKTDDEIRRRREEEEEKKHKEREEKERVERERQDALNRQAELQRKREQEIRERQAQPAKQPGDKWRGGREGSESSGEGKWGGGRSGGRGGDEGKWKKNTTERAEGVWAARREAQPRSQPSASERGTWKARRDENSASAQGPPPSSSGSGERRDRQKSGGGWRDRQNERRDDRSRDSDRPAREQPWKSQRSQDESGRRTAGNKKEGGSGTGGRW